MADNVRDFGARESTFDQYSDSVADNFGADDETLAQSLETVDQRYADSPTGRDRDRPHEAVVTKNEKGRVTEINAEYLDMMLEQYLEAVLKAEQELEERKCSGGWLGRVGRFFNETDFGKILKTGTKVIGGTALSVAATFGSLGIASPLALAMASRTAVDGVGEFIQYFGIGRFRGERGALGNIRDAKNRRAQEILKLMNIRNRIHNDDDRKVEIGGDVEDGAGGYQSLNQELSRIIEALDAIEEELGQAESSLGRIRSIGRTIRLVANTVVSGGIVAEHLAHQGLTMGVQNFGGGGHEVKMFSNGVHFLYNNADEISAEAIKHGYLHTIPHFAAAHDTVLGVGHTLGSNAPWGEIYGVGMGMVGGLVGSAAYEGMDAAKQAGIAENPGTRPVFTLRGRTESGNASHELSGDSSDSEAITKDEKGTLEAIKEQLTTGSVWEWTADRGKQLVEIVSIDGDKLKFYYIDDDGNRTSGINEYSGDAKIRDGKKVASSVEELKDGKSVDDTVKKLAADYHVKVPQTGEKWKVRAGAVEPKLKPEGVFASLGEKIDLLPGETIEIKQLGNKKRTANVIIRDAKGKEKYEAVVSTESLIKSCVPKSGIIETSASGAEGEEGETSEHAKILEEINKRIVEERLGPSGLAKDQVWVIKGNWYVIGDINEEAGTIMLWTGALAAGHVPEDNTLKDRKNFKTKSFEQVQSLIENASKASYRDIIKEKPQGGGKKNKGGGGGSGP